MIYTLLNVVNDLTNPDNVSGGHSNTSIGEAESIMLSVIFLLLIALIVMFCVFKIKINNLKQDNETKILKLSENEITEEEKQTITEYRKLTDQEKQIIRDTITTFNKPKE